MENEIVKVDPKEFGLTDETAKNIRTQFEPMLKKMEELEDEFNRIVKMPIDDIDTIFAAKELRKKYVKVRTGTAEIHKQQKSFYLAGGRFVDGWKNAQLFASNGKEETLEAIEKHQENMRRKMIEDKRDARLAELTPYITDISTVDISSLGTLPDDIWEAYLKGKKQSHADMLEAERIAEEEQMAQLQREEEAREAQRLENIRLKEEAEAREAELKAEREANEAREKAIREEAERKLEKEREAVRKEAAKKEADAKKEREEAERKLRIQQEETARVERELQAKLDAEEKANRDADEAKRKAQEAPDKEKLEKLAKMLETMAMPSVGSDNAKKITAGVAILLAKVSKYIRDNS